LDACTALAIAASALSRGATASLLLADDALRRGNAILNMGFTIGGAAGPALAGVVVAARGPGAALWLDAVSFLAVAVETLGVRRDHVLKPVHGVGLRSVSSTRSRLEIRSSSF